MSGLEERIRDIFDHLPDDFVNANVETQRVVSDLEKDVLAVVGAWQQRLQDLYARFDKAINEPQASLPFETMIVFRAKVIELVEDLGKELGVGGAEP